MRIIILLLLINISGYSQKTWEFSSIMTSDYFRQDSVLCFAEAKKGEGIVTIKIHMVCGKVISPIFVKTNLGNFLQHIDHVNKNGFYCFNLYLRRQDQWKSIDSGIKEISFYNGKTWNYINVNSNLKKLKEYAKQKD